MKTGYAKRVITPNRPCVLAGYAPVRQMKGVHDDLYVKTVFISVEETIYGCIAYDLLAVDHLILDPVKNFLQKQGISDENVMISAIHTHSGPGGILDTEKGYLRTAEELAGSVDKKLVLDIVSATCECISEALQNMEEGSVFCARGTCPGIGSNRNSPEFRGNDDLLCFEIHSGSNKMVLVHFACHPTVLNSENCLCSADFPGALQRFMEGEGYDMTLFLNGSCGDISTRFTRQGSGYKEVERYGKLLGDTILTLLRCKTPYRIHSIRIGKKEAVLSAKAAVPLSEAQELLKKREEEYEEGLRNGSSGVQKRLLENMLEGAQSDVRYARYYDGQKEYKVQVVFWQINDDIFIAVPGELFSQLSNPLQNTDTHFIGYTNGYMMYFADVNAYSKGYYEAMSSPFEKGEAERMMELIKEEIIEWRNGK